MQVNVRAACLMLQINPPFVAVLLGLSVHGMGQAVSQGQLPPALSLGAGQQKSQGTPQSASTCWLSGSVTERASDSMQAF